MINYLVGNIFDSDAEALVNTVNTVGVMGKGLALQFKKAFPNNYKAYRKACEQKEIEVGKMFVFKDVSVNSGEKVIINFPTKTHWKKASEYSFIKEGLNDLIKVIEKYEIKSVAIPPLGAGNGGLNWLKVKQMIESALQELEVDFFIYEPNLAIKEKLKKERVKLTEARALLLYILYDLVQNGEYVSEFSSEKASYFLQRFGAQKYFKLTFESNFYGPYSGKVRFILNVLNGSYLMGYSDMSKKPFQPLTLVSDGYEDVKNIIEQNEDLLNIANKTKAFLTGFYSDFSLELLSSVDYLSQLHNTLEEDFIFQKLSEWSGRKRSMFSNPRYISICARHLHNYKNKFSTIV